MIALALLTGCAESRDKIAPREPIPWWVPTALRQEVRDEIAYERVPEDYRWQITVPVFETTHSPTGLARGLCNYTDKVITVGWRHNPYEDRPLMPALAHEVGHARTGDPSYGH